MFTVEIMRPSEAVVEAAKSLLAKGLSLREVGEHLGLSRTALHYYMHGRPDSSGDSRLPEPTVETLTRSLAAIGGDIERAMPDWRPTDGELAQENQRLRTELEETKAERDRLALKVRRYEKAAAFILAAEEGDHQQPLSKRAAGQ